MTFLPRIKICGITSIQDANLAIQNGADAIGFIFVPNTPRYLSINRAQEIIKNCPPFITKVGLFLDPSEQTVWDCLDVLFLDVLQFHGNESQEFCQKFKKPFVKTIKISKESSVLSIQEACENYSEASAILLDTYHEKLAGGTGEKFNWSLFPKDKNYKNNKHFILAGGLNPENIAHAILETQPYAVDVSSGVENSPGIKSAEKIQKFCDQVRSIYK